MSDRWTTPAILRHTVACCDTQRREISRWKNQPKNAFKPKEKKKPNISQVANASPPLQSSNAALTLFDAEVLVAMVISCPIHRLFSFFPLDPFLMKFGPITPLCTHCTLVSKGTASSRSTCLLYFTVRTLGSRAEHSPHVFGAGLGSDKVPVQGSFCNTNSRSICPFLFCLVDWV